MLFSLPQLAEYTGYSEKTIRTYYCRGYLPNPKHIKITVSKNGKVYTKRLFTKEEMDEIKELLKNYTAKELQSKYSTNDIIQSKIGELQQALNTLG